MGVEMAKLQLTLFVVSAQTHQELIEQFTQVLDEHYPNAYSLNVIDVLSMPEKAAENQVFATPMLLREMPEPVMKVLVNISNLNGVLLSLSDEQNQNILV